MSFVLQQQQGWPEDALKTVALGPFSALRDGVTLFREEDPAFQQKEPNKPQAEFFMWEHFTTKPYFHQNELKPYPPLKKIGEIYTPWPSWLIVASSSTFPDPEHDSNLTQLFKLLDEGIRGFAAKPDQVVEMLATGDLGCTYSEEDAKEWMKDVRFVHDTTRGLDRKIVENVADVLKAAGVIPQDMGNDEVVKRVTGIPK
jgi:hypothetical protein